MKRTNTEEGQTQVSEEPQLPKESNEPQEPNVPQGTDKPDEPQQQNQMTTREGFRGRGRRGGRRGRGRGFIRGFRGKFRGRGRGGRGGRPRRPEEIWGVPPTSVYLTIPLACNEVYKAAGLLPYSLIKETGAAKILLGEELRDNKLVWCGFAGKRVPRDSSVVDCAIREFNEETGLLWDEKFMDIKKSINVDKTMKVWDSTGKFMIFLTSVPYKEDVSEGYIQFKTDFINKLKELQLEQQTKKEIEKNKQEESKLTNIQNNIENKAENNEVKEDKEVKEENKEVKEAEIKEVKEEENKEVKEEENKEGKIDKEEIKSTLVLEDQTHSNNANAETNDQPEEFIEKEILDDDNNDDPETEPIEPHPEPSPLTIAPLKPNPLPIQPEDIGSEITPEDLLTKEEREKLLFERRHMKQIADKIRLEDLGKSRLEYFDIITLIEAVEKHEGCLNPTAPEEEKKWLHRYFLQILKIPMVLASIRVLPVRLNLKGTGVPFSWQKPA